MDQRKAKTSNLIQAFAVSIYEIPVLGPVQLFFPEEIRLSAGSKHFGHSPEQLLQGTWIGTPDFNRPPERSNRLK